MEGISIPDKDVVALDSVAPGVIGLRIMLVNVFAVSDPGGWTLIDAGLYLSADRIRRWVSSHFGDQKPRSIVLTHGHFDHVGSLKELADGWDVPIYAHPLEMPYVTGKEEYPKPDPSVGGGFMSLMAPFYPCGPIDVSDRIRELPRDESVPDLPGWRAIHTPGHTDGHVSFFREEDRALIVGDAFTTTKQESVTAIATQRAELHGPPAYYTSDWDAARISVEKLAQLRPKVVAPGHGSPMAGDEVANALVDLATNFDLIARPQSKRVA